MALGAACLTWQYYLIFDLSPNLYLLYFVFSATGLAYTFQRYVKIMNQDKLHGDRMKWMLNHEVVVKLMLSIYFLSMLLFATKLAYESIFFLFIFALISFFYAWKLPFLKKLNLRDIPWIKIYLIAIVWTSVVIALPTVNELTSFHMKHLWAMFATFAFILAITIPFDIRDLSLDESTKKTIPQMFGIKGAKTIALILLISAQFILIYCLEVDIPGLLLSTLITIILILKATPKRPDLYFSFLLDGILILQPLLVFLFI